MEKLDNRYIHTEEIHNLTSPRLIVPMIMKMLKPRSVLDVGCGTGTWLKAMEEQGIEDYLGIDGDYVNQSTLKISSEKFQALDLNKEWQLDRKFDLIICLEVAEHLKEETADLFVAALSMHSDTILFSAAIPGQGGQNHLNEQWPTYWQKKFQVHGLHFFDEIRPIIWNDERIDWWYKQNMFLVKRQNPARAGNLLMPLVHPELFRLRCYELERYDDLKEGKHGIVTSLAILARAIKNKFKRLR